MIKRFRLIKHVGIEDDLTGKIYTNFREICNQLNKISEKSDKNAEKYFDVLQQKNAIQDKLKSYQEVCRKHNIHSASDLDEILTDI